MRKSQRLGLMIVLILMGIDSYGEAVSSVRLAPAGQGDRRMWMPVAKPAQKKPSLRMERFHRIENPTRQRPSKKVDIRGLGPIHFLTALLNQRIPTDQIVLQDGQTINILHPETSSYVSKSSVSGGVNLDRSGRPTEIHLTILQKMIPDSLNGNKIKQLSPEEKSVLFDPDLGQLSMRKTEITIKWDPENRRVLSETIVEMIVPLQEYNSKGKIQVYRRVITKQYNGTGRVHKRVSLLELLDW